MKYFRPLLIAGALAWALLACFASRAAELDAPKAAKAVSIEIVDQEIQQAMQMLSDATQLTIIVSEKVAKTKITAYVREMEPERALREVIEVNGFHYVRNDNVVWVLSDDEFYEDRNLGRVREVIPLSNARALEIAATLTGSLSKKALVVAYPETNVIVLAELEDRMPEARELVAKLDKAPETRVFQLMNAPANDVLSILQPHVGSPDALRADLRTNQIAITGTQDTIERLGKLITEFDKPDKIATRVFTLKYANAEATAAVLREVLTGQRQTAGSGVYGSQAGNTQREQPRVFTTEPGATRPRTATQTGGVPAGAPASATAGAGAGTPYSNAATPVASWERYRSAAASKSGATDGGAQPGAQTGLATAGPQLIGGEESGASLGPLANVTADSRTNSVIVTHVASVLERVAQIVVSIDQPSEYRTYQFQNANPDEIKVQEKLAGLLPTEAAFLQVDSVSRKVTIRANPEKAEEIVKLLKEWDETVRQVRIDAEILRVNASLVNELGIDWQAAADHAVSTVDWRRGVITANTVNNVRGGVTFPAAIGTNEAQGRLTIGDIGHSDYSAIIQALSNDSDTEVIARPRILCRDSQEAQFSSTRDEPYTVVSVSGQTNTTMQDVRFLNVGVTLMVSPRIQKSDLISLDAHLEISSLVEVRNNIPVVDRATAQSSINVEDGGTVLLGGLRQRSRGKVDRGLPGVRKLPIVGALFRNRRKSRAESEIVLILRPHIVGNNQEDVPSAPEVSEDVDATLRERTLKRTR